MISTTNVSLSYGSQKLFTDVNIKFVPGNCYGLIGANGAGKSTFLKILSGEVTPSSGSVAISPGARVSFVRQAHFPCEDDALPATVIRGEPRIIQVMAERDTLYAKPDFSEADG